jgi:hypothetical protein
MVMVNEAFFNKLKDLVSFEYFGNLLQISEDQKENQRDLEYLTRFLVYRYVEYDGKLDVEEYVDDGIIRMAEGNMLDANAEENFRETFELPHVALGDDALKQYADGRFRGRVGLTALEIVAVGISFNLAAIRAAGKANEYVQERVKELWQNEEVKAFSRPGLRGTQRIRRTVPFGRQWFRPIE